MFGLFSKTLDQNEAALFFSNKIFSNFSKDSEKLYKWVSSESKNICPFNLEEFKKIHYLAKFSILEGLIDEKYSPKIFEPSAFHIIQCKNKIAEIFNSKFGFNPIIYTTSVTNTDFLKLFISCGSLDKNKWVGNLAVQFVAHMEFHNEPINDTTNSKIIKRLTDDTIMVQSNFAKNMEEYIKIISSVKKITSSN